MKDLLFNRKENSMRKTLVLGSTIVMVAAYVFSRKIRNDTLIRCFVNKQAEVEDDDYTSISEENGENTVVYENSCDFPPSKSKTLKLKTNNSLITLNFKWNFSFGGGKLFK